MRNFLEQYITRKIGAEIKCCLTFLLILCFYCVYRLGNGFTEAGIIHMLEMVWAAYILEWVQVLVHCDFDEVDRLGLRATTLLSLAIASSTAATTSARSLHLDIPTDDPAFAGLTKHGKPISFSIASIYFC